MTLPAPSPGPAPTGPPANGPAAPPVMPPDAYPPNAPTVMPPGLPGAVADGGAPVAPAAEAVPPFSQMPPTTDPQAGWGPAAGVPAAANGNAEPLILMQAVTVKFKDITAVDAISLAVPAGAIVGVIGPSGSGKTTTIRTLTGALEPSEGRVSVLGEDPRRFHRATRESVGYMPQQFVLYPELTARENVDFMGALFGMLWRRRRQRVREVLELVELWDARNRRASALSGGMQRRLTLACTLVHEPTLLFLDEPTAGIDPLLRQSIWNELRRLRDDGRTILVTTQYVGEAEYCDLVALIARGRLIAFGPAEQLRQEAYGGDLVRIETSAALDVRTLPAIEGVVDLLQRGPREIVAVVTNAGTATPRLSDAIEAAGGTVASIREDRPSFDEVFAQLVSRHLGTDRANGDESAW